MKPRKFRRPKGRYLEHRTRLRTRFHEVDTLDIVWHGHYIAYFEAGRAALGREYGIGYEDFRAAEIAAPVTHASCDYLRPARMDEELEVVTRLYHREQAIVELYFEIFRVEDNTLLATGLTRQAFADANGELRLTLPQLMIDFYKRVEDRMVDGDA